MPILILIAVAHAFCCLSTCSDHPVNHANQRLAGALLASVLVIAFAWWIGQMRQHAYRTRTAPRWFEMVERGHGAVYFVGMCCVFGPCDLASIAHVNWSLSNYPFADELVVAIGLLVPLIGSWLCLAVGNGADRVSRIDSREAWSARVRFAWLQFRHTALLPLTPILLVAGLADVSRLVSLPHWERPAIAGLGGVMVLFLLVITLPWLIRTVWPTQKLPAGPKRRLLVGVLDAAGTTVSEILLWATDGRMANAVVAGVFPRPRYLLITDLALSRLNDQQLAAVAAHEAAHLKHRHVIRQVTSMAMPILALIVCGLFLTTAEARGPVVAERPVTMLPHLALVILGIWLLWHRRVARELEHQADATACEILTTLKTIEPSGNRPQITDDAVLQFVDALVMLGNRTHADWLHPATTTRVARLYGWLNHPGSLAQFHKRLQRISRLQTLLVATLMLICLYLA